MEFVIINLEAAPGDPSSPLYDHRVKINKGNALSAIAIAQEMASISSDPPTLLCSHESPHLDLAKARQIQTRSYPKNILQSWGLWRWQKEIDSLAIVAIGERSLKAGMKLLKMRGKKAASMWAIFFTPPESPTPGLFRRITRCICGSNFIAENLKRFLESQQASRSSLEVIAPGIPWEEYVSNRNDSKERFVFGMDESLSHDSGALLVIRAMAALWQQKDLPPWEVRMFGNGERFEEIMEEAEKMGVTPRLSILGDQPAPVITSHCNAWLAPGNNPEELPQTLWTGFAAGIPLICSDSNIHRERIPERDSAIMVNTGNPQELAKAMLDLMHSQRARQHYTAASIKLRPYISLHGMAQRVCSSIADSL